MAITAAQITLQIDGNADGATAALAKAESGITRLTGLSGSLSTGMAAGLGAIGLAADVTLAASLKAATGFEQLLSTIQHNTTLTNAQTQQMGATIKQMSSESGASLEQLGQGFMHISNLGFTATQSTAILNSAMQSAVATGGNVADVANSLASVMKEYGNTATDSATASKQAASAMDVLHMAAAEGNMTLEQFVSSSGRAIAMDANLGGSLTDVSAALSTLTQHGFDASQAGTQVVGMLSHIVNPAQSARAEIALLAQTTGVDLTNDFSQAGLQAKGLAGIMEDVRAATAGNSSEILKLIPALRGGIGALALAGVGFGDLKQHVLDLEAAQRNGGISALAYAQQQKTLATEMSIAGANVHLLEIAIGSGLMPAVSALLGVVTPAIRTMTEFAESHQTLTASLLAGVGIIGTYAGGVAVWRTAVSLLAPTYSTLSSGVITATAAMTAHTAAAATTAAADTALAASATVVSTALAAEGAAASADAAFIQAVGISAGTSVGTTEALAMTTGHATTAIVAEAVAAMTAATDIQVLAVAAGEAMTTEEALAIATSTAVTAEEALASGALAAGAAVDFALGPLGLLLAVTGAAVGALLLFGRSSDDAAGSSKLQAAAMEQATKSTDSYVQSMKAAGASGDQMVASLQAQHAEALNAVGLAKTALQSYLDTTKLVADSSGQVWVQSGAALSKATASQSAAFKELTAELMVAEGQAKSTGDALEQLAKSQKLSGEATKLLAQESDQAVQSLNLQGIQAEAAGAAHDKLDSFVTKATRSVGDYRAEMAQLGDAQKAAGASGTDLADRQADIASAMKNGDESTKAAATTLKEWDSIVKNLGPGETEAALKAGILEVALTGTGKAAKTAQQEVMLFGSADDQAAVSHQQLLTALGLTKVEGSSAEQTLHEIIGLLDNMKTSADEAEAAYLKVGSKPSQEELSLNLPIAQQKAAIADLNDQFNNLLPVEKYAVTLRKIIDAAPDGAKSTKQIADELANANAAMSKVDPGRQSIVSNIADQAVDATEKLKKLEDAQKVFTTNRELSNAQAAAPNAANAPTTDQIGNLANQTAATVEAANQRRIASEQMAAQAVTIAAAQDNIAYAGMMQDAQLAAQASATSSQTTAAAATTASASVKQDAVGLAAGVEAAVAQVKQANADAGASATAQAATVGQASTSIAASNTAIQTSTTGMQTTVTASFVGIGTAAGSMATTVGTAASQMAAEVAAGASQVEGTLSALAISAASEAEAIGAGIDSGITAGILAGAGAIATAAAGVVTSAIAAAKASASIASPSRRTHDEVGVPLGQGVVQGMLSQVGAVQDAARLLMNAAVPNDPLPPPSSSAFITAEGITAGARSGAATGRGRAGRGGRGGGTGPVDKDLTADQITADQAKALHERTTAEKDYYETSQHLAELNAGALLSEHRIVTDAILADDATQTESARQTAQASTTITQAMAAAILGDRQALDDATTASARAAAQAQLDMDTAALQNAKQMSDDDYNYWATNERKKTQDLKDQLSQRLDIARENTTAQRGLVDDARSTREILTGEKPSYLTASAAGLAAAEADVRQKQGAALAAQGKATAADQALAAAAAAQKQAYDSGDITAFTTAKGNYDLAKIASDDAHKELNEALSDLRGARTDVSQEQAGLTQQEQAHNRLAAAAEKSQNQITATAVRGSQTATTAGVTGYGQVTAASNQSAATRVTNAERTKAAEVTAAGLISSASTSSFDQLVESSRQAQGQIDAMTTMYTTMGDTLTDVNKQALLSGIQTWRGVEDANDRAAAKILDNEGKMQKAAEATAQSSSSGTGSGSGSGSGGDKSGAGGGKGSDKAPGSASYSGPVAIIAADGTVAIDHTPNAEYGAAWAQWTMAQFAEEARVITELSIHMDGQLIAAASDRGYGRRRRLSARMTRV